MDKAEAADRPKSSCETKGELPGSGESPNVNSSEELVRTEADASVTTTDAQVMVSFSQVILEMHCIQQYGLGSRRTETLNVVILRS